MQTLEEAMTDAAEFAQKQFNETGALTPMWIADTEDNQRLVIATPWGSGGEKDKIMLGLRRIFAEKRVVQFAFMTEAWILVARDGKMPDAVRRGGSLENHPDRREILMVRAENKERSLMRTFYILRPEHGKPTLKEAREFSQNEEGSEEGRMIGLLRSPS